MKTRQECFNDARQQFIESNPGLINEIAQEAKRHASHLGLSEQEFMDDEIRRFFAKDLARYGDNFTLAVISMHAPDEETKRLLKMDYYQEIADALLIPLDDYLKENRIEL